MSIINSLKTFSKKAFNVEPKGSSIDEVLDDMASKVTPGSGGGGSSSSDDIVVFNVVPVTYDEGDLNTYLEVDGTFNEIEEALVDHFVMFHIKRVDIPGTPFPADLYVPDSDRSQIIETYCFNKIAYDNNDGGYTLDVQHMIDKDKVISFSRGALTKDEKPKLYIR